MKQNYENQTVIPLQVVGSTKFGRFPKMSSEETFNMMISDGWLVSFPGYKKIINISEGEGRRIFTSNRWGKMIAVINATVYSIDSDLNVQELFDLETSTGDVFIDENTNYQIAICDKKQIWIWNWLLGTKTLAVTGTDPLDFIPGYITYQDTRFISPDISPFQNETDGNNATWRLSVIGDGTSWPATSAFVGAIQTKPDYAIACLRVPSRGNLLYVFGHTVCELWYDTGGNLFPYTRSTTASIDYGVVNVATIASNETIVAWLGFNEKSGYAILYSDGSGIKQISTDGINFRLGEILTPEDSFGFLFKQYGHVFYQITFYGPGDNITYVYDFMTESFFTMTDENQNFHIAKNVAFFNNTYYFVSTRDGNIYELNGEYYTYDYGSGNVYEIPKIRICPSFRTPTAEYYTINNITFTIEQGTDPNAKSDVTNDYQRLLAQENSGFITTEDGTDILVNLHTQTINDYVPTIELSISNNGGESFGNRSSKPLNPIGKRRNRLVWWSCGASNDTTVQLRFVSFWRSVAIDGEVVVSS